MVKNRKYITVVILVLSILLVAGCGINKKAVDTNKPEAVKYGKELMVCPEDLIPAQITSCEEKNGIYVVLGREYGVNQSVWYVDNNGKWEKEIDLVELFGKCDFCSASVSGKGELFVALVGEENKKDDVENKSYLYIDENGNVKLIEDIPFVELNEHQKNEIKKNYDCNENYIVSARFIDGMIYAMDCAGNIYEIDKNVNSVRCVYKNETDEQTSDYTVKDKIVIACTHDTVWYEGIENHDNEKSMGDKLESFFNNCYSADAGMALSMQENSLWTMSGDKICKYNFDDETSENYKAFGYNKELYLRQQVVNNNILYSIEFDTKNLVDKLYRHEAGKEYISENSTGEMNKMDGKLRVWSLYESPSIESTVRSFSDQYPNIDVEYEVGMDMNSGMTVNDVIKKFNTELLAGSGPDIIYIDGLPVDKYVSDDTFCNISEDLSALMGEAEYYNNILEAYKSDNNIYAVPSFFYVVSKLGTEEAINASADYNTFVEYIKNNKNVIGSNDVCKYIGNVYYRDIQSKLMENSLDKGELEVFFENSKKICELTSVENLVIDKESTEIGLSVGYRQYDENVQQLTVDYIRNIVGPYISMNETKKKCDAFYEIPAVDYKDKCFLLDSFGISATTNNMDSAKEYLKYVLAYNDITYTGQEAFPIKKEACETLVDSYIETHSNENNLKASDTDAVAISSECKKLLTNFDEIENPIIVDDHIDAIFFAQLTQYLNGELSKSEAVNSVFEKIGIYISE